MKLVALTAVGSLLLGVYIGNLAALLPSGRIGDADMLQVSLGLANLIVVAALAGITLMYAKSTREIAEATRTQADATKAQAAVVAQQLSQGVRPIVRFPFEFFSILDGANLVVRNVGLGPALNVKCWIQRSQPDGSVASHNNDGSQRQFRISVIEVNEVIGDGDRVNWQFRILPTPKQNDPCTLFAVYEDVYRHCFVSKAVYKPIDVEGARPLGLREFTTEGITREQANDLLSKAGYTND